VYLVADSHKAAVRLILAAMLALIVIVHAAINAMHIYYLGFPDGGTEYDRAVKLPLTLYALICFVLGSGAVFVSFLSAKTDRGNRSLIIATVLYALFSFVAHYGIEYYFGAMMMLNRGSGG